jgi:hypothetical protein
MVAQGVSGGKQRGVAAKRLFDAAAFRPRSSGNATLLAGAREERRCALMLGFQIRTGRPDSPSARTELVEVLRSHRLFVGTQVRRPRCNEGPFGKLGTGFDRLRPSGRDFRPSALTLARNLGLPGGFRGCFCVQAGRWRPVFACSGGRPRGVFGRRCGTGDGPGADRPPGWAFAPAWRGRETAGGRPFRQYGRRRRRGRVTFSGRGTFP